MNSLNSPGDDHRTHFPRTVKASLEARMAPFPATRRAVLEDLDVEASRAVAPPASSPRRGLIDDFKLLFAALGAGNRVVPFGDNSGATRQLSEYARSLQAPCN